MTENAKIRCLVLGGCGFIGSHLVDGLLDRGYDVSIFDKSKVDTKNVKRNLNRIHLLAGDFTNKEDLKRALARIDYIFHFIGTTLPQSSTENPIYDIQSNVISTIHMLEIAKSSGVRKIIFPSSGGTIYGLPQRIPIPEDHPTNPICAYGISKLFIEKYLYLYYKLYGLDYVSLRISNAYGERQDPKGAQGAIAVFLGNVLEGKPITIWGDGTVVRDYIYVQDIVEACLKAMESRQKDHQVFNVGSGTGTSLNELIELVGRILGKDIEVKYSAGRNIDTPVNILDTARAQEVLSWRAKVPIAEGLRKVVLHELDPSQPIRHG